MWYFIIYIVGVITSLFSIHKWKDNLEVNHYNNKEENEYDDWGSNAEAFLGFSIFWPLFWSIHLLIFFYQVLLKLSIFIEKQINKQNKKTKTC